MPATRIEPGADMQVGITGSDFDVVPYLVTGLLDVLLPKSVTDEVPGVYGEASINCPNAVLVDKKFGGVLGQDADGTWSAIGLAIYRVNPYSGGARPYTAYARRLSNLELPIWQSRPTHDADGTPRLRWVRTPRIISRPVSSRVKTKFINSLTDDQFSEKVDPLVGALFYFTPNGQPYILVGADGFYSPGTPLRAEYRFLTSGPVPAYPGVLGPPLYNDSPIPALKALEEYNEREFDDGAGNITPIVDVAGPQQLYITSTLDQLPGF